MKKSEAITSRPPRNKTAITAHPKKAFRLPALEKSKGYLSLTAVLVVAACLSFLGYRYRDFLFPSFRMPEAAEEKDETERPPPKLNANTPPGPAPDGMVWIPGGEFYMGIDIERNKEAFLKNWTRNQGIDDTQPVHKVYVDGFWMDKHEITNEEFTRFVKATKYVTIAEQQPDPKDFPRLEDKSKLAPFSLVFRKPAPNAPVDYSIPDFWTEAMYGASWQNPWGPTSNLQGKEKHPAVHICYNDALAYCRWAKKRLPTEAEWEFAARGGRDRNLFTWGDELNPGKKWMANTWQGDFPFEDDKLDGHLGTAPVGAFPANGYGLFDMAGNVWEWCADWYRPEYYEKSPDANPKGPMSGFDPLEQGTPKRVQRGGSFLCAPNYCARYIVGTRGKGEPTSAATHTGFRCVKDPN